MTNASPTADATSYRPRTAILELDERFRTAVEPADFPQHTLRWRNQRWAGAVGLGDLSDKAWLDHFGRFSPLPENLPQPMALAYHGHQFGTYNPDLGDGRGFLFAQLEDSAGRLLDLGTKGSGQTPWSRQGDGRLTLKGGVREVLAAGMLEALGVYTSKAFSLIETGEQLWRGDEPSPTRSAVLVRLSHSHIRFGAFQRLAYLEDRDAIGSLVGYCLRHYCPGADEGAASADAGASALRLFQHVVQATAELAASWMAAGFVHGVLNTDNMVVTGESFDYGPWRFLPASDPNFTAAYFDQTGLYRFGRQPTAAAWNLSQLGSALTLVGDAAALEAELKQYPQAYRAAFRDRCFELLGVRQTGADADEALLSAFFGWMTDSGASWPQTFFDWFGGAASEARADAGPQAKLYAASEFATVRSALLERTPSRPERLSLSYFQRATPETLLIDDVEALWSPIAHADDWSAFVDKMNGIEAMRAALDLPSRPTRAG